MLCNAWFIYSLSLSLCSPPVYVYGLVYDLILYGMIAFLVKFVFCCCFFSDVCHLFGEYRLLLLLYNTHAVLLLLLLLLLMNVIATL